MRRPADRWLLASGIIALLLVDQCSKFWVQSNIRLHDSIAVVPSLFRVRHFVNRGAVGGIGWGAPLTLPLLVAGSALTALLLVLLYGHYSRRVMPSWRVKLFIVLSITPLLSHSVDRIRQGYVVDFLQIGGLPLFNFADLLPDLAIILLAMEVADYLRRRNNRAQAVRGNDNVIEGGCEAGNPAAI